MFWELNAYKLRVNKEIFKCLREFYVFTVGFSNEGWMFYDDEIWLCWYVMFVLVMLGHFSWLKGDGLIPVAPVLGIVFALG